MTALKRVHRLSAETIVMDRYSRKMSVAIASLIGILVVYTVAVVAYLMPRNAITNLDYWYHISVGQGVAWGRAETFVDGLYPIGYPLLLRFAVDAGLDALRFGQALSWLGGALLLTALFAIAYHVTQRTSLAFAGTVLLLLNVHFLRYATYEGNDMLAAGLQGVGLAALWYATICDSAFYSRALLAGGGILIGFAYLTRYPALISMSVGLLYLVVHYRRSAKTMLGAIGFFLIPFLLITTVQWFPSWLVYQNPLYNAQAKNVWFGIYGENDWVNNWQKVPDTISLAEVIQINPRRFVDHWFNQLQTAFLSENLWRRPLHLGWLLALPVVALFQRISLSHRLLILMTVTLPVAGTALAWVTPRFLLLLLWVQALLLITLAFYVKDALPARPRIQILASIGLLAIAALSQHWEGTFQWIDARPLRRAEEVNSFLRLAGMERASEVATNDPYLHVTDRPGRDRYAQTTTVSAKPEHIGELLNDPRAKDWKYLVLDYQHGFGEYGDLRGTVSSSRSALVPLSLTEEREIFCVKPCTFHDTLPLDLKFENGMRLKAYRTQQTERSGALFLYWEATQRLERSYKVSVRLRDGAGREIVQIDNVPQLWTGPTTEWAVAETIVDYYSWQLQEPCSDCQVFIVVYDGESTDPVLASWEDGSHVGPLIPLR